MVELLPQHMPVISIFLIMFRHLTRSGSGDSSNYSAGQGFTVCFCIKKNERCPTGAINL